MNLYQIDERLRMLEDYGVDEDGCILEGEELRKAFEDIQMSLSDKIENTACFIKNLLSDAEQIKTEEERLAKRRKNKEKLAENLRKYIDNYIVLQYTNDNGEVNTSEMNKWKFETPKCFLSYRKSEKAIVDDATKIPKEYITTKVEEKPNLTEIKKAIKGGKQIEGAHVETNLSMQIK